MKKVLINFADAEFKSSQKLNSKSGRLIGGFDEVIEYSPESIDLEFLYLYYHILRYDRGAGYWLWKPYIINQTLKITNDGDYIFYCDSGAYFVHSILPLIKLLDSIGQDVMAFEIPFVEKHYSKRDALILMDCDYPQYTESLQRLSGYILIKNTEFTKQLFKEYLDYACDDRILTDRPNTLGKKNYTGFVENRHDQTVFSLLSKKYEIKAFRDPSHWGDSQIEKYPDSKYPTILQSTRKRDLCMKRIRSLVNRKIFKMIS